MTAAETDNLTISDRSAACTVVLDVGKTLSKLSLWTRDGELVEKRTRANARAMGAGYHALDAEGIEHWLMESLGAFAKQAPIDSIIPVGHGAAVAVVREGRLTVPPMDYESDIPSLERARYEEQRDPFSLTGSPALPQGLNLGMQLHMLDSLQPQVLRPGATLLLWPQYWAWRLCGVASAEVSSLGCHSDLWYPAEGTPSGLMERRGWARLLPPLRRAGDRLGDLSPEWSRKTGLSSGVGVYCGLHDSNAALLAARAFPEISDHEATVLSTGTWFVAMRTPRETVDLSKLPEFRDCLVNVDVYGKPVPSARFMGGREIELLTGLDTLRIDIATDQGSLLNAVPDLLKAGTRTYPSFVPGSGPFPHARGRWAHMPGTQPGLRAAVGLYLALVADFALDLIGARDRIVVEGRFAAAQVLVRALAALRPEADVFVAHDQNDVACGALRLINPTLQPQSSLQRVKPLDVDLGSLRDAWRHEAERLELAA